MENDGLHSQSQGVPGHWNISNGYFPDLHHLAGCPLDTHKSDHLSGKPGNVTEFNSCQGNVRIFTNSQGNFRDNTLSKKTVYY